MLEPSWFFRYATFLFAMRDLKTDDCTPHANVLILGHGAARRKYSPDYGLSELLLIIIKEWEWKMYRCSTGMHYRASSVNAPVCMSMCIHVDLSNIVVYNIFNSKNKICQYGWWRCLLCDNPLINGSYIFISLYVKSLLLCTQSKSIIMIHLLIGESTIWFLYGNHPPMIYLVYRNQHCSQ